jgi:cytochrome c oxidase assembly protein subunit 15
VGPERATTSHDGQDMTSAARREGPPPEGVSAHRYDDPPVQLPGVTPRAFLRITQVTVVIVVLNIVTGAAVRLSDSGLGCPDWPTCSKDRLTPPLSLHPAIEFGNRMVVVVLCIATAIALLAALGRIPRRRDLVWLSGGLLGGVLGEAVLGAVVVYTKLNPYAVMTHFMVGIALLTDAFVLALRAGRADSVVPGVAGSRLRAAQGAPVSKVGRRERRVSQVMLGLLAVAVAAGTATTGAGPHAGGPGAKRLPIALEEMARIHSGIVICLVALTIALLYLLDHTSAPSSVLDRARLLLGVMVLQGGIGYVQYFTHLPALLVGFHVFGATLVWMAMLWFYDGLTHHSLEPGPAADPPGAAAARNSGDASGSGTAASGASTPPPVPVASQVTPATPVAP